MGKNSSAVDGQNCKRQMERTVQQRWLKIVNAKWKEQVRKGGLPPPLKHSRPLLATCSTTHFSRLLPTQIHLPRQLFVHSRRSSNAFHQHDQGLQTVCCCARRSPARREHR